MDLCIFAVSVVGVVLNVYILYVYSRLYDLLTNNLSQESLQWSPQ